MRKSHTTITRHQEYTQSKTISCSSLFPFKMIAKSEWTQRTSQQNIEQYVSNNQQLINNKFYKAWLREHISNRSTSHAFQQAFLKLCLVNLISTYFDIKDTHVVENNMVALALSKSWLVSGALMDTITRTKQ